MPGFHSLSPFFGWGDVGLENFEEWRCWEELKRCDGFWCYLDGSGCDSGCENALAVFVKSKEVSKQGQQFFVYVVVVAVYSGHGPHMMHEFSTPLFVFGMGCFS